VKSGTQLWIAFFSAMAVTLVAVSDMGRTSPGALATVHGRVPDLAGRNDCSECHGGIFGTLQQACLECHEPIETQLADSSGLHGTLGARAEQCGLCHAEHHGALAPLVHGQSFALAGVSKVAEFDHNRIGFAMDGAHLGLECTECHEHARAAILPEGARRFLGLDQDCATCHEDAHEGRMAIACASCHGQTTWDGLASLDHERFLPLVGGHGDLACAECHAEGEPHALEILGGKGAKPAPRDCVACHESPHTPSFAANAAALSALPAGATCVTCHASKHETFHERALLEMTPAQHAGSGFALDPPHDTQACTDCHAPARKLFQRRYPGRKAEQCSACHADVHEGQFTEGAFAGEECTACHDPLHFMPHTFDSKKHERAALALEGQHLELECEACHERPESQSANQNAEKAPPRIFHGTPSDCADCHADAHDGDFVAFLADLEEVQNGECAHCHDAQNFANAAADFDHGRFTDFAVLGAHAESECTSCHVPRAEPDANQRSFGRVEEQFGSFEGCVTCHADPHGGLFDAEQGFPATVEGHSDCARCHVESSFRTLPRAFDHGYWTGFALAGAHAEASCAACHAPLAAPDELARTTALAAGPACADCHEDPHAGQFVDKQGAVDCARCHASEPVDFLSFDHERDARFALGEAHSGLACAACHHTERKGELAFVRYSPLGTECADCHGSNAEVLLRRQSRKK
jgi:hypothetical protein